MSNQTLSSVLSESPRPTSSHGETEAADKEQHYPEMIFEKIYDMAIARLPWTAHGKIEVDGERFLSVPQVVEEFGGTESLWRDKWLATWGNHIPEDWRERESYTPAELLPRDVQIAMEYAAVIEDLQDDMTVIENHSLHRTKLNEVEVVDLHYHVQEAEQELRRVRDGFYRYILDRLGYAIGRGGSRKLSKAIFPKSGIQ